MRFSFPEYIIVELSEIADNKRRLADDEIK